MTGRTARRSHSRKNGHTIISTAQGPEGVGLDGVEPFVVLEVPRRAAGRVELQDLQRPFERACVRQCSEEAVNGVRVLDGAEELAAAPARDVTPLERFVAGV